MYLHLYTKHVTCGSRLDDRYFAASHSAGCFLVAGTEAGIIKRSFCPFFSHEAAGLNRPIQLGISSRKEEDVAWSRAVLQAPDISYMSQRSYLSWWCIYVTEWTEVHHLICNEDYHLVSSLVNLTKFMLGQSTETLKLLYLVTPNQKIFYPAAILREDCIQT